MCLETKPGGSSPTRFLFWMNVGFPPAPNCQPPFQAMKMFLYEELGVKKTTSSWQKVHPKQENIPENKALLGGGHVTGGRLTGWPAMIYILQPPTLPSSQKKKCLAPHRKRTCPEKKRLRPPRRCLTGHLLRRWARDTNRATSSAAQVCQVAVQWFRRHGG